jgi:N-acetyl sugar amidotransferase
MNVSRCKKCILPNNYPGITFDNEGVCNECRSFEKRWSNYNWNAKEKELEKIFSEAKRKNRRYDCLVPVSGGKDSAYALYICTQKYKLKALAVNFNNGFASPSALHNLSLMAREFDADYISWAPRWSNLKQAYRTFFLKTGDFCPPCSRAITSYTYRLAQKERIPLIVLGLNPKTDMNPSEVEIIDQRLFKDVVRDDMAYRDKKDFLIFEPRRLLTKRIELPAYIPFQENEMIVELERALQNVGGFSGDMHFDCLVSTVAKWLRRKKWGFDKKTQKYAAFVRDGQMTRDEAMAKAEGPDVDQEPQELEYFMKMLDVTRSDVERAKDLSSLNFKHYDKSIMRIIAKFTGVIDKDYK